MSTSPGRAEIERLLGRGAAPRRLLRERVVAFVAIGAGLGALHLVATGRGGDHVAVTAMLSALIPVFAPACFVPAVLSTRERGRAPLAVAAVRLGVAGTLGAVVAGVHLAVWAILAAGTGSIGGPSGGDVPFMVVVVAVTSVVASVAFEVPARGQWTQPVTVATVVLLYVASFVIHGIVIGPSLTRLGATLGAGRLGVEALAVVASLAVVWALLRREVRAGAHTAEAAAPGGP